ncbi:phytochrome sensor protein [Collibacillus ludicampi]|uniref:Phytochrome sensor protein n=1 Tax=Collibacillus ludicampi TaxID=2771369 RepID=A0AAV4LA71_9BACL|nr:type II secretion system F family protein [Collibacillus ludicampi]GIM44619.1 phytochrome sensor protein [Collibacillus ludicampi]
MAQFRYQAVNLSGKSIRGYIEAADQTAAAVALRDQGLFPIKLMAVKEQRFQRESGLTFLRSNRVKLQDLAPFCRQFATLVRSGVTVSQSLEILMNQTENKILKKTLGDVLEEVRKGNSLQESFSHNPKVFNDVFVHMIAAGEFSGRLDTMLDRVATIFERDRMVFQKLITALIYPITISIIAMGVSIFLLVYVVPMFVQTFLQQGVELPLPTKITLQISDFLVHRFYYIFGVIIVLFFGTFALLRTERGCLFWDSMKLRIPIFGKLIKKSMIARFTRTFSTLVASAIPILQGLELSKKIVKNKLFEKAIDEAQEYLHRGEPLHVAFKRYPQLFTPMVTNMIAIGEETGALEHMLEKIADFYETDVREMSARLTSLLEPLMILFLAGTVGTIIVSLFLPMMKMINLIQQ